MIDPDYRLHCHTDVECCSQAEVSQLTTNLARNIRDQLRQQAENIQFTKADILAKFDAELQDAQERFNFGPAIFGPATFGRAFFWTESGFSRE